jgi:signal transduction histidine kinase
MKEQEQKVRQLREEIEQGERKRVAALLHDGVGQTLQAINLGLRRLRAGLENTTEENSALLDGSIEDLRSAISELRDLSQELRPFYLERMSLVEAIRYLCNELQGRVNPRIKVKAGTGPYEVDDRIKLQCFLIVREALSNALRHAEADRIRITFERLSPHRMRVDVYDNGKGFDPDEIARTGFGLGLPMIKERAEGVSRHAEIFSTPGKGTRLHFYLPLGPADNNHSSSPDPSGSGDEAASPCPNAAKRKASAPAQSKRGEIPWPSA